MARPICAYPELGEIRAGDNQVRLTPITMKVLLYLMVEDARLKSKKELFQSVWGTQVVSDDALTRAISDLRVALTKLGMEKTAIETLPKRGYRLLTPIIRVDELSVSEGSGDRAKTHDATVGFEPLDNSPVFDLPGQPLLTKVGPTSNNIFEPKLLKTNWLRQTLRIKEAALFVIVAFLALAGIYYALRSMVQPTAPRIVVSNIKFMHPQIEWVAADLTELIHKKLVDEKRFAVLSDYAVSPEQNRTLEYLHLEHGAKWMIEGHVRPKDNKVRIVLNIVEANTSLIAYAQTWDIDANETSVNQVANDLIVVLSELP